MQKAPTTDRTLGISINRESSFADVRQKATDEYFQRRKNMRFIIVRHEWWMHHKKWVVEQLDSAKTKEEAEILAGAENNKHNYSFNRSQTLVIEIGKDECIPKNTRLTWRQRISGNY